MNIIMKANVMNTHDAVLAVANALASAERRDRKTIKEGRDLREAFRAIVANGDGKERFAAAYFAEMDAMNTRHAAERLAFHNRLTDKALELGIDVPPGPDTGGDDGVLVIMSGGDR